MKCPSTNLISAFLPIVYYLVALLIVGIIMLAISYSIARNYGGTLVAGIVRCGKLLLFLLISTQSLLVQVGKAMKYAPSIPRIFRRTLRSLEELQFGSLSPSQCLHNQPFSVKIAEMAAVVIVAFLLLTSAFVGFLPRLWCARAKMPSQKRVCGRFSVITSEPAESSTADTKTGISSYHIIPISPFFGVVQYIFCYRFCML
jgi:hypothetical protein